MHRATDNCMQDRGRNFGLFGSNPLKSSEQFPQDRFSDLERAELVDRLERLEEVRPAEVARGKALVANPNYPGKEIVQEISRLLARHL